VVHPHGGGRGHDRGLRDGPLRRRDCAAAAAARAGETGRPPGRGRALAAVEQRRRGAGR